MLDGPEVEEIEPLLAGSRVGAAQLDALGSGEAVEPAGEGDGLKSVVPASTSSRPGALTWPIT